MIKLWAAGLKPDEKQTPVSDEDVELVREWLRTFCRPKVNMHLRNSSYTLKDFVRNWSERYVSNGAMIKGALLEGYRIKPIHNNNPYNAYINISLPRKRSKEYKDAGIR